MDLQKTHKGYMWYLPKPFSFLFIALYFQGLSQSVVTTFYADSANRYLHSTINFKNKTIPVEYGNAINIALSYYPELADVKIRIKVKRKLAPLAARPSILSTFLRAKKRNYVVTISNHTINKLNPILLKNLSFNAQIGVIGHELSHIAEYNSKNGFFFIALALKHVSKKSMDKFEYNTDRRCIEHYLGFQLLSWSKEVREKLDLSMWGGANKPNGKRERYMNPETILQTMTSLSIYKKS
jgi:hypothetical protein